MYEIADRNIVIQNPQTTMWQSSKLSFQSRYGFDYHVQIDDRTLYMFDWLFTLYTNSSVDLQTRTILLSYIELYWKMTLKGKGK